MRWALSSPWAPPPAPARSLWHPPAEDVRDLGLPVALRLPPLTLQPLPVLLLPLQLFSQLGAGWGRGSVSRGPSTSEPCLCPTMLTHYSLSACCGHSRTSERVSPGPWQF